MDNEKATFKVLNGGPLEVSGNFSLRGADGTLIEKEGPVYLCRCGASNNKPFCDGSHNQIGFSD